jgi:hypothetical protein
MEKAKKKVKICLASSSGGHFEQLMMLKPLIEKYDGYVVTEKIGYDVKFESIPVKYVVADCLICPKSSGNFCPDTSGICVHRQCRFCTSGGR